MTSGGVSATERLPIERAEPEALGPTRQVLTVEIRNRSQEIAHVGELDFRARLPHPVELGDDQVLGRSQGDLMAFDRAAALPCELQIGRASCRERGEISVGAG